MKSEIFKTWSLVLQLGLTILVPLLLLVAVGYFLKEKLGIDIMLILVIIGVLSGVRNAYVILRNYVSMMKNTKNKDSELLKRHMKSFK